MKVFLNLKIPNCQLLSQTQITSDMEGLQMLKPDETTLLYLKFSSLFSRLQRILMNTLLHKIKNCSTATDYGNNSKENFTVTVRTSKNKKVICLKLFLKLQRVPET